jgi:two-component system NtrC family sensor kinase
MTHLSLLLVEQVEEGREQMRQALTAHGHTVDSAEAGLERFSAGTFDIVITETDLPNMDGIEMIQAMRALDPTVSPIVVSSNKEQETAVRALEAGARSFLVKPFGDDELNRRVAKAMRERKRLVNTQLMLGDLIRNRGDLQVRVAERERYLNHLLDAAPFGILSTDPSGEILTINRNAEEMYGCSQQSVVGRSLSILFGSADFSRVHAHAGDAPLVFEAEHLRGCGQRFPAIIRCRGIKNEVGSRIAQLYVVEDRSEREQIESQLVYAERLSMLGQLAPRIAHEFKTPLQIIGGAAEMVAECLAEGDTSTAANHVETILPAAEKMNDLVHQMLDLGKPEKNRKEGLNLAEELEKILTGLGGLGVVKYCRIERDFDTDLPPVIGDPAQIEQVFRNLIVNAAQAVEESGRKDLMLAVKARPDEVEVRVEDSGPGIEEEHLERIFQPFFTTKTDGKGTGLGLPIVKTILERHRASIIVNSEIGRGTVFTLKFPCAPAGQATVEGG